MSQTLIYAVIAGLTFLILSLLLLRKRFLLMKQQELLHKKRALTSKIIVASEHYYRDKTIAFTSNRQVKTFIEKPKNPVDSKSTKGEYHSYGFDKNFIACY